ncbi:MAG: hypothetical protein HDT25_11265 [Ruminococcus sp.]|nr:hypothetical protein [Ruminococcus sp.]
MKNIRKTISAIISAAVIFSMVAMPASADWKQEGGKLQYEYASGKLATNRLQEIDGVMYKFDSDSYCAGKYTGWTKTKNGGRKYYLDGYSVKGDMPVGKNICTFDKDGILTEKTPVAITITQDTPIHSGDKVIPLTAKLLGKGGYFMIPSSKFERWENGEWVDCLGEGVEYITCDCLYDLHSKGYFPEEDDESLEEKFSFLPEEYLGTEITAGYYRLTYYASGSYDSLTVYAIIKVTD